MLSHLPRAMPRSKEIFFSTVTLTTSSADFRLKFASLLKECKSLSNARKIHQQILVRGLLPYPIYSLSFTSSSLGTDIVVAYLASGSHGDALFMLYAEMALITMYLYVMPCWLCMHVVVLLRKLAVYFMRS